MHHTNYYVSPIKKILILLESPIGWQDISLHHENIRGAHFLLTEDHEDTDITPRVYFLLTENPETPPGICCLMTEDREIIITPGICMFTQNLTSIMNDFQQYSGPRA